MPRPLVIAGMHRSGASLVARILTECGVELGDEEDLRGPAPSNTEGFSENRRFVAISDRLLAAFEGAWNDPPELPPGWERSGELDKLRREARELLGGFDGSACWGWKDPRASLTLRFWTELIPDLRPVICVRHPRDVASSLAARESSSEGFGLHLWELYNRRLLDAADDPVVTHYDAYFADAQSEVRRLLGALEIDAPEEAILLAAGRVNEALRHHDAAQAESGAPLPMSVSGLYERLCEAAGARDGTPEPSRGETERRLVATLKLLADARAELERRRPLQNEVRRLADALAELGRARDLEVQELRKAHEDVTRYASSEHEALTAARTELKRSHEENEWRKTVMKQAEETAARLDEEVTRLEAQLATLHASRSFRYTAPLRRIGRLLRRG